VPDSLFVQLPLAEAAEQLRKKLSFNLKKTLVFQRKKQPGEE